MRENPIINIKSLTDRRERPFSHGLQFQSGFPTTACKTKEEVLNQ